ncbi:MAG: sulfotransferase [Myxococcota bacterium]
MAAETARDLDLSLDGLLARAREQAGLSDFGDEGFRDGLGVLLETYERAGLSAGGRKRTRRRLLQLLGTRLRIEAAFARHPEIRERAIRSPVYLTGLPRTGTSALFNLLACDPASRPLLTWEGMCPDPLPGLAPGQPDPRLEAVRAAVERDRQRNPDFDKIHYARADGPEECVLLLAYTFCDLQMGVEPLLPPYRDWFQAQDLRASYAYYADLLRMLDWQRPGERWLLKSPAHLWALDVLVEMFPDACIVQTHRNPLEILPSYCSMIATLMSIRESVDSEALGPVVLEFLARSLERGLAARDRCPERFVDVDYRRFLAAPLEAVEEIYGSFGLPLDAQTRTAMARHLSENPQGKHGAHRYSLEEYGLSPSAVGKRLRDYIERFDLPGGP